MVSRFLVAVFFTVVVGSMFAALLVFGEDMSPELIELMKFVLAAFVGAATIAMARLANPENDLQKKYDDLRMEMLTDRSRYQAVETEQRRIISDLLDRLGIEHSPKQLEAPKK